MLYGSCLVLFNEFVHVTLCSEVVVLCKAFACFWLLYASVVMCVNVIHLVLDHKYAGRFHLVILVTAVYTHLKIKYLYIAENFE